MSFQKLLILHIPFLKMYWYAECCFYKSLQDACVIFHMVQQFLFIWNKGLDLLALGRGKGSLM